MLDKAIRIANSAHEGQVDIAGEPYILHPLRVMLSLKDEAERICAVPHDVIEDTDITVDDLWREGFTEDVIAILDCLTRRDNESYDDFITRILVNNTACRVKLADLADNMDLSRIDNPTKEDYMRLGKYKRAVESIEGRCK